MPQEEDLDYYSDTYKYRLSLFRSSTMYSHFKIIFNLNLIYIHLYVYPGVFLDTFKERRKDRRKLAALIYKGRYWDSFSKKRRAFTEPGFFNKHVFLKALRFSEYSYPPEFFLHIKDERKKVRSLRNKRWLRHRFFHRRPQL